MEDDSRTREYEKEWVVSGDEPHNDRNNDVNPTRASHCFHFIGEE